MCTGCGNYIYSTDSRLLRTENLHHDKNCPVCNVKEESVKFAGKRKRQETNEKNTEKNTE